MGPQTLNKEGVKPTQSLPVASLASSWLLCPSCGYEMLWGGMYPSSYFCPKGLVMRALTHPYLDKRRSNFLCWFRASPTEQETSRNVCLPS